MNLLKNLQAIFHPERYHGWGKTKRFFEGWYYKIIDAKENHAIAIIPGIAMDEQGNKQAFIQILDGKNQTAIYHKFDNSDFVVASNTFQIKIKNNLFTKSKLQLDLSNINGMLEFKNQIEWTKKWYSPGIMGPYSFIPFMECNHGILSMDHTIDGQLNIDGKSIDLTNGKGYLEKDWGKSFPSAYIWMQSNHFNQPDVSFKASVAKIPWLGNSFVGFIAGLWFNNQLIQFTTYNSTKLRKSFVDKDKVELVMENRQFRLEVLAHRDVSTTLASPILGLMDGRINESMTSKIEIQLLDKLSNRIIFNDIGRNAGLEVAGNIEEIIIV